jgi:hypothetical protein
LSLVLKISMSSVHTFWVPSGLASSTTITSHSMPLCAQ